MSTEREAKLQAIIDEAKRHSSISMTYAEIAECAYDAGAASVAAKGEARCLACNGDGTILVRNMDSGVVLGESPCPVCVEKVATVAASPAPKPEERCAECGHDEKHHHTDDGGAWCDWCGDDPSVADCHAFVPPAPPQATAEPADEFAREGGLCTCGHTQFEHHASWHTKPGCDCEWFIAQGSPVFRAAPPPKPGQAEGEHAKMLRALANICERGPVNLAKADAIFMRAAADELDRLQKRNDIQAERLKASEIRNDFKANLTAEIVRLTKERDALSAQASGVDMTHETKMRDALACVLEWMGCDCRDLYKPSDQPCERESVEGHEEHVRRTVEGALRRKGGENG